MKRFGLRSLGVIGAAMLFALFVAAPAAAMDTRQGQSVSIPAGQTVQDDLYLAGNSIDVAGTVNGDLVAAGNSINISGTISRDLVVMGNQVTVSGTVDGSLRVVGGTVTISGPVSGDLLVGGGSVTINSGASVGRDLAIGAGTATINGPVTRNAYLGGGDITLAGVVGGDVKAAVNSLTLTPDASITGALTYSAAQPASIAAGATTLGGVERTAQPRATQPSLGAQVLGAIQGFVGIFAFGLILLAVFPGFSRTAEPTITRHPWASVGIGFAVLLGVPVAALFAFILGLVVGGWWISLLLVVLYLAALAAGYALGGYGMGRWTLHLLGTTAPNRVLALFVGTLILWALGLLPVVGWLVGFAAVVMGLGGLCISAWTSRFGGGGGQVAAPVTTPAPPVIGQPAPLPS